MTETGYWKPILNRAIQVLKQRRARILTYHSVSNLRTDRWSIGRRQFERHMRILRARDLSVVSLNELVRRMQQKSSLEKLIAITFDDGYQDFIENAMPILRDYQMPATVFLPVALLGKTSRWSSYVPEEKIMDWQHVEFVLRNGYSIGSHSLTHPRLPAISNEIMREEIGTSRRWLQENLGVECLGFAYPFGEYTSREIQWVKESGYAYALGFGGLWGNGLESDLFELNRDALTRDYDDVAFQSLLNGWGDWARATRSRVPQ